VTYAPDRDVVVDRLGYPDQVHRDDDEFLSLLVLQREGLAFSMVYGQGPQRLAGALAVLEPGASTMPQARSNWRWLCDKCSDADCEHRLFSDLQATAMR
jgi:hypothetical protein